ncbi:LysR substrate-binding domain-containing protein [Pseudoalteromonas maricaloris]|uniref:LysR family transcriptional regulator n=1 Tax=Pseudoalteromonas maricaloris TaxID=184924 RepID=A0A8I2KQV1_9GAMM|nr:LysR substrate-binding domain-containing protein [Pseudoalteromonas maricaloris]NLR22102.1 LysR family transcriptional regulator [Pseudoalteromonas maricaloris]WOX31412.1 LysR substrate-binding domain-containing protein [Pseudoalteromonas maricaloris]
MAVSSKTEDLEAFICVVDTGSFSAAANLMDEQIAKVSRAVTRLEKSLRVTLFNRTTRRIELTEEGELFLRYARQALNTIEQGEEALKLLRFSPAGKLRVDAASPFVFHQLTPILKGFNEAFPDITLEITSHDSIIDLLEHKTDIAIRIGDLADSNLHARLLGRSKLHLVASPDYLSKFVGNEPRIDLPYHNLIGFTDAPHLNVWPLQSPQQLNFSISASSGETVRQLCIAGHGIALLSNFMVRQDIKAGRLVEVFTEQIISPNRREAVQAVYYQNSAVSSRISAFLDYIAPRLTL